MQWFLLLSFVLAQGAYADHTMRISTVEGVVAAPHISEFVRAAYQQLGYQIEILPMPAKRSLHQARDSEDIDSELARTIYAAGYLPKHTLIPVPVGQLKVAAFVNNEALVIHSWSDLKNYRVAAVRGHLASANRLAEHGEAYFLNDAEQVLTMLERGRVDVAILPRGVGLYWIKKNRHRELNIPPTVIEEIPIYHFLHSRHQDLVEPLSQIMAELREQAELIESKNLDNISPAE